MAYEEEVLKLELLMKDESNIDRFTEEYSRLLAKAAVTKNTELVKELAPLAQEQVLWLAELWL